MAKVLASKGLAARQSKAPKLKTLSMKKPAKTPPDTTNETWADPNPKRILVPLDFSEPSKRAVCFAREWAARFGARVYLLHVIEPTSFMSDLDESPLVMPKHDIAQAAKNALTRLAEEDLGKKTPVSVLVRKGKAWDEIVKTAKTLKIDLIIIPTYANQGLERIILGSTAERVVRYAPCPVLTLRRRTP